VRRLPLRTPAYCSARSNLLLLVFALLELLLLCTHGIAHKRWILHQRASPVSRERVPLHTHACPRAGNPDVQKDRVHMRTCLRSLFMQSTPLGGALLHSCAHTLAETRNTQHRHSRADHHARNDATHTRTKQVPDHHHNSGWCRPQLNRVMEKNHKNSA